MMIMPMTMKRRTMITRTMITRMMITRTMNMMMMIPLTYYGRKDDPYVMGGDREFLERESSEKTLVTCVMLVISNLKLL